ncbi:MAG: hypothetical protein PVJ40_10085 [Gammaproteobacteria bacterium]|jgi:hypothetical protein
MSAKFRLPVLVALWLPVAAFAAGSATIKASSGELKINWRNDQTLRMQKAGDKNYMVVRDGKAYSVVMTGGTPRVMDLSGMMGMAHAMAGKRGHSRGPASYLKPGSFKDTGRTESVAGIEGEVYRMSWTDHKGRHREADAVLSDDPRAVDMTRAYLGSIRSMFQDAKIGDFQKAMPGSAKGLLRVGKQFRVESLSGDMPPESLFELPARPMTLQQMMRGG